MFRVSGDETVVGRIFERREALIAEYQLSITRVAVSYLASVLMMTATPSFGVWRAVSITSRSRIHGR
jgi:hypothetical protein